MCTVSCSSHTVIKQFTNYLTNITKKQNYTAYSDVVYKNYWTVYNKLKCIDAVGWVAGRSSACKNWVVRYLHGYLSGARCNWFAYGPVDAVSRQYNIPQMSSFVGSRAFSVADPKASHGVYCDFQASLENCTVYCLVYHHNCINFT